MQYNFKRLELMLHTLAVFRTAVQAPALTAFSRLCVAVSANELVEAATGYTQVYACLKDAGNLTMGDYLSNLLKDQGEDFARALITGIADQEFEAAAERDWTILSEVSQLNCKAVKTCLLSMAEEHEADIIQSLPEWQTSGLIGFAGLKDFYMQHGAGLYARHRAFRIFDDTVVPVLYPDPIGYEQMVGYDWQRQAVYDNTHALVWGSYVNNVLLYGDSGTGKSATVKSMLNVDAFSKLVLIEISKRCLSILPGLMNDLAWRPQKFIVFIDDLSFDSGDANYSFLKVMLEGGLGVRPKNVAIYVTSNRRQLVRRLFSDRDELNGAETVEEKTSLADRFGIRIPFFSLNQEDYLTTVEALVRQAGVDMKRDELREKALQWELEHSARTPRTARQFADDLAAKAMDKTDPIH